jgi:hypothetical protein
MEFRPTLALVAATQIGQAQGLLEAKINSKLEELLLKYKNTCPNQKELRRVITILNNLDQSQLKVQKQINRFNTQAQSLDKIIKGLEVLVLAIQFLPLLLAPGTPVTLPIKLTERLLAATSILRILKNEQKTVVNLISRVLPEIQKVGVVKTELVKLLSDCISKNPNLNTKEIVDFFKNLQRDQEEFNTELGPNRSYRASNGKDYFFEIIEDTQLGSPIPRRVAVAKDSTGIIILRGGPSFSSSTKVLIDELKLRIDRQLP